MKLKTRQTAKHILSSTMHTWLPILQSDLSSLDEAIEPFVSSNPFIEVRSGHEKPNKRFSKNSLFSTLEKHSVSETLEALTISKKSLFETLYDQISPPLFPTKISQDIAYAIIENINHEGYFEIDLLSSMALELGVEQEKIQKIRERFVHLEPVGIGAIDFKEAFLFQLENVELEDGLYRYIKQLIYEFESIETHSKDRDFNAALKVMRSFKNPPAIEFLEDAQQVIPDIFVFDNHGAIEITLNDDYYPEIVIDVDGLEQKDDFIALKLKEAKDLVDALDMRKATLYKIGFLIVENQYDFFFGKEIKPMRLRDIADELQRNPSTISRAIAGKYLSCSRGVIPLKYFFSAAIEEGTSNSAIKEYMKKLIKNEKREKPLSDIKLLALIETEYKLKMGRRTIAKYRQEFNIAGSAERKKLYSLKS